MIKLLLVDDHAVFRKGLKRLLDDETDFDVAGEANSAETALAFLAVNSVDVVLLDINMPGTTGLNALKPILHKSPNIKILILSMHREQSYAYYAMQLGAHGYVTKDSEPEKLLEDIRRVFRGQKVLPNNFDFSNNLNKNDGPTHMRLSPREMEIFKMITQGVSLTQIAINIKVSIKTVATHRRRILDKLDLDSNADMISYALHHQLFDRN